MAPGPALRLRDPAACRWDLVALGEALLRFDPGDARIESARAFQAWPAGAELNVAAALARCFGLRTTLVTALVDNPVGRLIEALVRDGGVDVSHIRWVGDDGVGRAARNGLYFAERGRGVQRNPACYDRGHTAISQLQPGAVDWERLFAQEGSRWFHVGGVFCALSDTTPLVAREAMQAARRHGAVVSYDVNYREALWRGRGGKARSDAMTRELAPLADVLFGVDDAARDFPDAAVVATTRSADGDWAALCRVDGRLHRAARPRDLAIVDRIGAGDAFAAGVIYGLLAERGAAWAVECGAACGALAMTTPGDQLGASLADFETLLRAGAAAAEQ